MRTVEASAKTRKEAIQKALEQLGAELHEVKVDVVDEGSKGLFGLGARDAVVRVTAEGEDESSGAGAGAGAGALLEEMIRRMGMEATVTSELGENGGLHLNIASQDSAILIGRKGRTLSALQYLVNRMTETGDSSKESEHIVVDVENYIERRRQSLEEMARGLARKAKETGRTIRVKPMNPQERRIMHMALENDPDVRTYSTGEAMERAVVIAPKNPQQGQHRERRGRPDYRGGRGRGPQRGPRGPRKHPSSAPRRESEDASPPETS